VFRAKTTFEGMARTPSRPISIPSHPARADAQASCSVRAFRELGGYNAQEVFRRHARKPAPTTRWR
jgi:hypothetical protein